MLETIFKTYKIKEALIKEDERLKLIILKREEYLSLTRWINLINALKQVFHKEIDFLTLNQANKLGLNLKEFNLYREREND